MKKDTKIAALTQARISQYVERISNEASLPEKKFVHMEEQLVRKVLRGYHLRWVVEEVHREIKEDLNLESIRLFGYNSIKNMSALAWIAASFYYTKLAGVESMDILLDMARSVVYRLKLKEITGFIYYKLFYLVNSVLKGTKRIRRTAFKPQFTSQLALF